LDSPTKKGSDKIPRIFVVEDIGLLPPVARVEDSPVPRINKEDD
jgi:hypothetical protein